MPRRSKKSLTIETLKEIELLSIGVANSMSQYDTATYKLLRRIDYLLDLFIEDREYAALRDVLNRQEMLL